MEFFQLPIEQQIELATKVARRALGHYEVPTDAVLDVLKHRENTVFAVTHPNGRKLGVLRVHRTGYQTERSIISEFQWMQALREVGVNTPAVISARGDVPVVAATIDELPEPRLCDMLEWIEGQPPRDEDLVDSFRILGELHATCHAQVRRWTLPAGFERQSWDEAALLDGVHPIIAPAWENWALSDEQRALVLECRAALRQRLRQWGKGPARYGLIHADLMPENLIICADGVRLIDFDDCGFGWYLYDPASALLLYYWQDVYPELLKAWTNGYRSVRSLSEEELNELPTYLLLRCFYGLGWLQTRRNSEAAQLYIEPLIALTCTIGEAFLK